MSPAQLPIWIEYAKALGAPMVALVAGLIASGIAYRQWDTARKKLKLDLFDRRMAIYSSALEVVTWMADPHGGDGRCIADLSNLYPSSRWLFGAEVAEYISDLLHRARRISNDSQHVLERMGREQKIEYTRQAIVNVMTVMPKELSTLDKLFDPYLTVSH